MHKDADIVIIDGDTVDEKALKAILDVPVLGSKTLVVDISYGYMVNQEEARRMFLESNAFKDWDNRISVKFDRTADVCKEHHTWAKDYENDNIDNAMIDDFAKIYTAPSVEEGFSTCYRISELENMRKDWLFNDEKEILDVMDKVKENEQSLLNQEHISAIAEEIAESIGSRAAEAVELAYQRIEEWNIKSPKSFNEIEEGRPNPDDMKKAAYEIKNGVSFNRAVFNGIVVPLRDRLHDHFPGWDRDSIDNMISDMKQEVLDNLPHFTYNISKDPKHIEADAVKEAESSAFFPYGPDDDIKYGKTIAGEKNAEAKHDVFEEIKSSAQVK